FFYRYYPHSDLHSFPTRRSSDLEIFSFALAEADESARCIIANDGLHALEKINSDHSLIPDFIFIDMNMPRMNGQECLVEIKKIQRLKNVPVFMYSTSAGPSSILENSKLGAVNFIAKPADINVLTEILSGILKRSFVPFLVFLFFCSMIPHRAFSQ